MSEIDRIRKPNRISSTEPKRTQFWCGGCDAQIVVVGSKCANCGYSHKNNRRKK